MSQQKIKFNNVTVRQPDEGLAYSFETTYTEDSDRTQDGVLTETAMFTVEAFAYTASNLTQAEMSAILQIVAKGQRFLLHYLSPYYGYWRDDWFYVGKGSLAIGAWIESDEVYSSLTFNMIGVNPIA